MANRAPNWRPGPAVCRCCFTEGCYKDLSTEYFWMGRKEIYSNMLVDTLNVTIACPSKGPNGNTRLICEVCIGRLRDAAEFKRQVVENERTFLRYLDPDAPLTDMEEDVPVSEAETQVKVEAVKQENEGSDEDFADATDADADYQPAGDTAADDDDDEDDLDNQPLTKLASKIPKKESVDLMDLLDNTKAAEKRKSSSKAKTPASKKTKPKKEAKATSSKPKPEKKKKADRYDPARANAELIVRHTTAYPFRVNDKSILCVYCQELYVDAEVFRAHMDQEHAIFSLKVAFHNLPKLEFIKADLTNLRCRLCSESHTSLDSIAAHLAETHQQNINFKAKLGVMPYFLQKDTYNCAVCQKNFPSLFHLNRHTITHFLSYVCHVCGCSYIATTGLLRHVRSKHQEYQVSCKRCGKVFPTMEAKDKHRRIEKSCMPYCCPKCSERFLDWKSRKRHMELAHGQTKRTYRCADCDLTFNIENSYYEHFKLHHSDDSAMCKHCGLKFLSRYRLRRHMSKHVVYRDANS